MKRVPVILYVVAKLQYQAMPWHEMKKDGGGVGINYEDSFVPDCKSLEWIGINVIKPKANFILITCKDPLV